MVGSQDLNVTASGALPFRGNGRTAATAVGRAFERDRDYDVGMSHSSRPTGRTRWLVAIPVVLLLAVLHPVDTAAEIAAGVNGVAQAAEFSATFTLQRFSVEMGRLVAEGTLTDIPPVQGQATTPETLAVAVTGMSRSCEMVHLDFGPLDVKINGTVVHLNDFAIHVSDPGTGPMRQVLCEIGNAPDDVVVLRPLLNELLDLVGCLMRGSGACSRQAA